MSHRIYCADSGLLPRRNCRKALHDRHTDEICRATYQLGKAGKYNMQNIIMTIFPQKLDIPDKIVTGERLGGRRAAVCRGSRVHDLRCHRHMLGLLHGRPDVGAPQDVGRGVNAPVALAHHGEFGRERGGDSQRDSGALKCTFFQHYGIGLNTADRIIM